jgi:CheY-like chemotaxis protein
MPGLKCFFIDDLPEEHLLFKLALEQTGTPVECFYYFDGRDCLNQLKGSIYPMPDVIFVDVNMSGMNGIAFLQQIKSIERLWHLPVYMYSVEDFPSTINAAMSLGAAGFIVKKSDPDLQMQDLKAVLTDTQAQRVG